MKEVTIKSYDDLIQLIETNELDLKSVNDLLTNTMGCIFLNEHPKERLIEILKAFVNKWRHTKEKPIFIDS